VSARTTNTGFKLRGIKGWMWRPDQYLSEIPVMAEYQMNFLMNCYLSMCDIEHHAWGDGDCNRWWEPIPATKKAAYAKVVKACADHGIQFCFSMNPNLGAKRFADPDRSEDVRDLWQHYDWMQRLGVQWFNISLDDISAGKDATNQARLANEIFRRLRAGDQRAQLIFCPTYYWGDGQDPESRSYLAVLAAELNPEIYVFWTGDRVYAPRITRSAADKYRALVRHRLVLWDNYPVNDNNPTLNLGPVTGRDRDLCEVIDGYMSNPLCPQNQINRVPMLTCADYAYNPWQYDPARSIGQAIMHLAHSRGQRLVLKQLVETYPGMLLLDQGSAFNPVRERFRLLAERGDASSREAYLRDIESLSQRFNEAFPQQFDDAKATLEEDLAWLKRRPNP
jgi:hyaluronoglucosaminidase